MRLLGQYKNGNYQISIFDDGTRIRETHADDFTTDFAENIDLKICNRCDRGCRFCHEGSTPDGILGDILSEPFLNTLHSYQEVAIGGGNIFEHPDLILFLERLKEKQVIANITLNQSHFEKEKIMVKYLIEQKLVYGVGISLESPTEEFIYEVKKYSNAVVHVINGILEPSDMETLADNRLKLLILGFKRKRRGETWYQNNNTEIATKQEWLKDHLEEYLSRFQVVSFDNLALEQLEVKRLLGNEVWEEIYAGDDGTHTFYIDMAERKYAESSMADEGNRYDLLDSVDEMFVKIRKKKQNE